MMMPEINLDRPKVALNRWRRWMKRTPFVGDVLRAQWVACALSNCAAGRHQHCAYIYKIDALHQFNAFEKTYSA